METHPFKSLEEIEKHLNLSASEIREKRYQEGGIWFHTSKTLIVGTFPPKGEYEFKGFFQFSSSRNKFWKHIDALYNSNYFYKWSKYQLDARLSNTLQKISFALKYNIGFVDIYTKIERCNPTAKDIDLIEKETIFDTGIFKKILKSNVSQLLFVYSHSQKKFEQTIKINYNITPNILRVYCKNGIPLGVKEIKIENKILFLTYVPIHGNNTDVKRRKALKKALGFDFS